MKDSSNRSNSSPDQGVTLASFDQPQQDSETDVERMHAAVYREKTDPREGNQPVPIWLILSSFALLMWGGWYLGSFSANFSMDRYEGPAAHRYDVTTGSMADQPVIDPMLMGKRIYSNCSACHQANGMGVAGQFPPLDASEWVNGREDNLARILLQGLAGRIVVKGKSYSGNMPKWSHLDDRSLAAVLTYIRGSWSNNSPPVSAELVAAVREATAGRATPWSASELESAAVITVQDNEQFSDEAVSDAADSIEDDRGQSQESDIPMGKK